MKRGGALALLLLAGCVSGGQRSGPGLAESQAREPIMPGTYACIVEAAESTPTPQRCTISDTSEGLTLESSGAMPLRGKLHVIDGGFHFQGEIGCVNSGCPRPIETDFFLDDGESDSYSGIAVLDTGTLLRLQIRRE